MKLAAVVFAVVLLQVNALKDNEVLQQWTKFQADFGKSYRSPVEASKRFSIFQNNLDLIEYHNAQFKIGETNYTMGINQFADWTNDEFKQYVRNGFFQGKPKTDKVFVKTPGFVAPTSVDWRNEGLVTGVKDQGTCGGCWAFSATGGLEGQLAKTKNTLISLSEQYLIDCAKKEGNEGCNGGYMTSTFDYVKEKGIVSEADYPYTGLDGKCKGSQYDIVTKSTSYVEITEGDEEALTEAIATQGPICVGVDGSAIGFQLYSGGIYTGHCSSTELDHAILAVGYGTKQRQDYYIVKNSWGTSWGEQGYIRLARNDNNKCGVASEAIYPTI